MSHHHYMQRCLELAKLGAGYVAPNPMVGAVLVYDGRIIGEGWHEQYGEAHAEVNCIASVKKEDMDMIPQSTLYVSLEPCAHHGKTPPCTDLIIQHKIPKVIIGCLDPFKEVNARLNDAVGQGKGVEKLEAAGIEVEQGVMEKECKELNKRFFTFHTLHRPYVILKWAQTADGKMAAPPELRSQPSHNSVAPEGEAYKDSDSSRSLISNEYSNRLVHQWRSQEAAILIGTNTALLDNPELTTRLWPGNSPVRLVVDMNHRLPSSLRIFNGEVKTIVFNSVKQEERESLFFYKLGKDKNLIRQIIAALYQLKILSVLVEGGARLLQSFIDEGVWDEIRTVTSLELRVTGGLAAPVLANAIKIEDQILSTDKIEIYKLKDTD